MDCTECVYRVGYEGALPDNPTVCASKAYNSNVGYDYRLIPPYDFDWDDSFWDDVPPEDDPPEDDPKKRIDWREWGIIGTIQN